MASKLPPIDRKTLEKLIQDYFSDEKPQTLTILVTGKTGVGKSRLVNALVGKKVAKEGQKRDPCTSEVSFHEVDIEGVKVSVCDSPGLQEGTGKEDLYIQEMKEKIKNIDLMIYCIKMDDTRFYDADKKAIRILTEEFGNEVWNHAVVALTFANKIEDPDEGEPQQQHFKAQLQEWKQQLENYFNVVSPELHIPPVIPAGNWRNMNLPDRENWLSDLWVNCYETTKASARQCMYRINRHRLRRSGDDDSRSIPDATAKLGNRKRPSGSDTAFPTTPHATTRQGNRKRPSRSDTASQTTSYSCESKIPNQIPLQEHHEKSFWKATLEGILIVARVTFRAIKKAGGAALTVAGTVGGTLAIEILKIGDGRIEVLIGQERITISLHMLGMEVFMGSLKY